MLNADLPITIASFGGGIVFGWFLRGSLDPKIKSDNQNTIVLLAVTLIWILSVLADITSPTYETPIYIHGLMGAIVGFFYKPVNKD